MRVFEQPESEVPTALVDAIAYVVVPYAPFDGRTSPEGRAEAISALKRTIEHRARHSFLVYETNATTSLTFPFPRDEVDERELASTLFKGVDDEHRVDELEWLYGQRPKGYDHALESIVHGIEELDAQQLAYRLATFVSTFETAGEDRAAERVRQDLFGIVSNEHVREDRGRIIERIFSYAPDVAQAKMKEDYFPERCRDALENGGYAFGRLLVRAPSGNVLRRFERVHLDPRASMVFRAVPYGSRIPLASKGVRTLN